MEGEGETNIVPADVTLFRETLTEYTLAFFKLVLLM
jgi:hypothetical protein